MIENNLTNYESVFQGHSISYTPLGIWLGESFIQLAATSRYERIGSDIYEITSEGCRILKEGEWVDTPNTEGTTYWDYHGVEHKGAIGVSMPTNSYVSKPAIAYKRELTEVINKKHLEIVNELLGGATMTDMLGWAENESLAIRYLAGNAPAGVIEAITEKLTLEELSISEPLQYWSLRVVNLKAPLTRYVKDVAEGIKRRALKRVESLEDPVSETDAEDILTDISTEIYGIQYEKTKTLSENIVNNTIGGAIAKVLARKKALVDAMFS